MNSKSSLESGKKADIDPHVGRTLDDVEKELILATLVRCGGNRAWASDILGISVRTLRSKLQRYSDCVPRDPFMRIREEDSFDEDAMMVRLKTYDPGDRAPS